MAKYKSMAADLGWDGENKPIQPSLGRTRRSNNNERMRMMREYLVVSDLGARVWYADDEAHALEQHTDAFPDEGVITVAEKKIN